MDVVPSVLVLADMHHSEELKQACIDYLADNSSDISVTTWNTLQLHPDITYKLFCDVSAKKSKKEVCLAAYCASLVFVIKSIKTFVGSKTISHSIFECSLPLQWNKSSNTSSSPKPS